ncbi:MAG: hypothetical protein ACE365_06140 [Gammaproteobacteria bacterium]
MSTNRINPQIEGLIHVISQLKRRSNRDFDLGIQGYYHSLENNNSLTDSECLELAKTDLEGFIKSQSMDEDSEQKNTAKEYLRILENRLLTKPKKERKSEESENDRNSDMSDEKPEELEDEEEFETLIKDLEALIDDDLTTINPDDAITLLEKIYPWARGVSESLKTKKSIGNDLITQIALDRDEEPTDCISPLIELCDVIINLQANYKSNIIKATCEALQDLNLIFWFYQNQDSSEQREVELTADDYDCLHAIGDKNKPSRNRHIETIVTPFLAQLHNDESLTPSQAAKLSEQYIRKQHIRLDDDDIPHHLDTEEFHNEIRKQTREKQEQKQKIISHYSEYKPTKEDTTPTSFREFIQSLRSNQNSEQHKYRLAKEDEAHSRYFNVGIDLYPIILQALTEERMRLEHGALFKSDFWDDYKWSAIRKAKEIVNALDSTIEDGGYNKGGLQICHLICLFTEDNELTQALKHRRYFGESNALERVWNHIIENIDNELSVRERLTHKTLASSYSPC